MGINEITMVALRIIIPFLFVVIIVKIIRKLKWN